jgi:hypothetical protein
LAGATTSADSASLKAHERPICANATLQSCRLAAITDASSQDFALELFGDRSGAAQARK